MPTSKKVKTNDGWSQSNIHCCLHPNSITFLGGNLFTFYLWLLEPCKNRACGTVSTFKIFMKFVNVISYQNYVKTEIQGVVIQSTRKVPFHLVKHSAKVSIKAFVVLIWRQSFIRVLLDFDITHLSKTWYKHPKEPTLVPPTPR